MIKGEEAWFKITNQSQVVFWKIYLDYVKNIERNLENTDYEGRIKKMLKLKDEGNMFLKGENYEKAINRYKGALGISFPKELQANMECS